MKVETITDFEQFAKDTLEKLLGMEIPFNYKFNNRNYQIAPIELQNSLGFSKIYTPDFIFDYKDVKYIVEVKPKLLGRYIPNKGFVAYDPSENKYTNMFMKNYVYNRNQVNKDKWVFINIELESGSIHHINHIDANRKCAKTKCPNYKLGKCKVEKTINIYDITDFKNHKKDIKIIWQNYF